MRGTLRDPVMKRGIPRRRRDVSASRGWNRLERRGIEAFARQHSVV